MKTSHLNSLWLPPSYQYAGVIVMSARPMERLVP